MIFILRIQREESHWMRLAVRIKGAGGSITERLGFMTLMLWRGGELWRKKSSGLMHGGISSGCIFTNTWGNPRMSVNESSSLLLDILRQQSSSALDETVIPRNVYLITSDDSLHSQMIINQFIIDATSRHSLTWSEALERRTAPAHVLGSRHVVFRWWSERWRCWVRVVAEISVPRLKQGKKIHKSMRTCAAYIFVFDLDNETRGRKIDKNAKTKHETLIKRLTACTEAGSRSHELYISSTYAVLDPFKKGSAAAEL